MNLQILNLGFLDSYFSHIIVATKCAIPIKFIAVFLSPLRVNITIFLTA